MIHRFHFEHHRREAIVNRRRFSVLSAVLLMIGVAVVGVTVKRSSFASSSYSPKMYISVSGSDCNASPGYAQGNNCYGSRTPGTYRVTIQAQAQNAQVINEQTQVSVSTSGSATFSNRQGGNSSNSGGSIFNSGQSANWYFTHVSATESLTFYVDVTIPASAPNGNTSIFGAAMSWSNGNYASGTISIAYNNPPAATPAPPPYTPTPAPTPYPTVQSTPKPTVAPTPYPTATPKTTTTTQTTPAPTLKTGTTTQTTSTPVTRTVTVAPKPGIVAATTVGGTSSTPADTVAPTVPDGFTAASSNHDNAISLSWSASTDAGGIKSYNLEHSLDQSTWSVLASTTETTYSDSSVGFSTQYYYRLTATDIAGNTSNYAFASATSPAYEANIGSNDAQLSSDDATTTVTIPAGAIPNGADCSVIKSDATVPLAKNQIVVAGAYQLLCKDSGGNEVASFTKALRWDYSLKMRPNGYGAPLAVVIDDSQKATKAKSTFNKKTGILTFAQSSGSKSIVLASKNAGIPVNLIVGILLVLGLFGGVITFVLRRKQQANYSEYIRSKYYDI
jgi:hypothetical protein